MTISVDDTGHLHWNVEDEYQRMELSLALYQPRNEVASGIIAAYNDPDWPWTKCDGCTGVSEAHFPRGYRFPPCVCHDHCCWLASLAETVAERNRLRREGDALFYKAMRDYRVNPIRAAARWAGVRGYWILVGSKKPLKNSP
jgi:hypothetical protein